MSPLAMCNGSWIRETGRTTAAAALVVAFCGFLLAWDPGFFWIDDAQSGALPGYCEMARAWLSGEVPLLSRSSWWAGALGAEYPAGVFSPSLALSSIAAFGLDLPLPLAAAIIALIHLAILAAGTFRLARRRGLAGDLALLATVVASLNGWIVLWGARNWGVCLYSFAWLPWFWWGLEGARQPGRSWVRFLPAGLFLALLITAGWPYTVLMAGVLSAWVMVQAWLDRPRLRTLWPVPLAWALGLALSAPAWLMFLEYTPHTFRIQETAAPLFSSSWTVPLDALPALVLPNVTAHWWVFGTAKLHVSAELAGGLVPLVILLPCVWLGGRTYLRACRWHLALAGLLLLVVTAPALGRFQYSFRWLPLFFLALGLLAAESLAWLRQQGLTPNLGKVAFYLVAGVWLRAMASRNDIDGTLLASGLLLLALAFGWLWAEARGTWQRAAPAAVAFCSCLLTCVTCAPYSEVPTWDLGEEIRQPGPLDPSVRYLSVHTLEDVFDFDDNRVFERMRGTGEELYFGNTAGYAGLDFVNGYSPLLPSGMHRLFPVEVHGTFPEKADAERILRTETGPDGLLQLMGVDGLVISERFADCQPTLIANGWHAVARRKGGLVFHRTGLASPRVRAVEGAQVTSDAGGAAKQLTGPRRGPLPGLLLSPTGPADARRFAPANVTLVEDGRLAAVADVVSGDRSKEALVVFSRPWFPGYEASCDGRPVPVEVFDLMLPAVRLPAGTSGRVVLEYRPASLVLGCRLVLGASGFVLLCLLGAGLQRLLRRHDPDSPQWNVDSISCRTLARERLRREFSS